MSIMGLKNDKRLLIGLFLGLWLLQSYIYGPSSDFNQTNKIIVWKPQVNLTWNDFHGAPDSLSTYKAMTFTQIDLKPEGLENEIIMTVPCYFSCEMSWSKNKESTDLLKHEKLHFDICELSARKIRAAYNQHVSKNLSESSTFFQSIYTRYDRNYKDSINQKYDLETEHGIIADKQKQWETKIANELKKMDKFSSVKVAVRRIKE